LITYTITPFGVVAPNEKWKVAMLLSKVHHLEQLCKALREVFFPVRFQSEDRLDGSGPQEPEERCKINGSSAHREVFIAQTAIIMHVDFFQKTSKGFDPFGERRFGESVLVSHVQTEAAIGRIQPGKELTMKIRAVFPDILKEQQDLAGFRPCYDWLPNGEASIQVEAAGLPVVVRIISRMADHLDGLKDLHQVKKLLVTKLRYLANEGVGTAGTKVPERAVKNDSTSPFMQLFRCRSKPGPRDTVELICFKPYLNIDPQVEDPIDIIRQIFPGHVYMHQP
jgi:hypothetical protein